MTPTEELVWGIFEREYEDFLDTCNPFEPFDEEQRSVFSQISDRTGLTPDRIEDIYWTPILAPSLLADA